MLKREVQRNVVAHSRWTAASIGLAVVAFVVAATWMGWVVSQGTDQLIQPGWWAFRYAAPLVIALVLALAALITARIKPQANRKNRNRCRGCGRFEMSAFWVRLVGLVVQPFPG